MCNCSGREKGVVPCMWMCTLHRTIRIYILFCIDQSINYQPACGCIHEFSPLAIVIGAVCSNDYRGRHTAHMHQGAARIVLGVYEWADEKTMLT